jgi:hypothetical protein
MRNHKCLSCVHFHVHNERPPGSGTVADRTSGNFTCAKSEFPSRNDQVTVDLLSVSNTAALLVEGRYIPRSVPMKITEADDRKMILENQYNYKPPTCVSYQYGANNAFACVNCKHSVSRMVGGIPTIVGCTGKNIWVDYDLIAHAVGNLSVVSNSELDKLDKIDPVDCKFIALRSRASSVYDFADDEEYIMPPKETKTSKWKYERDNQRCTLDERRFLACVEAYQKTGCRFYKKTATRANKGKPMSLGFKKRIDDMIKNSDRLSRKEEFLERLKILDNNGSLQGPLMNYPTLVITYGFLSTLQEQRLQVAERDLT